MRMMMGILVEKCGIVERPHDPRVADVNFSEVGRQPSPQIIEHAVV
jgi:hypothetical protein